MPAAHEIDNEKAYILGVAQTRFRNAYQLKKKSRKVTGIITAVLASVIIIIGMFFVTTFVSYTGDTAMQPGFQPGNVVLTNRLAYLINPPQRGDVITFRISDGYVTKTVQRRIIALPGESVEIKNGKIMVNGQECQEGYIAGTTNAAVTHVTVPTGTYYVLCDNRDEGPDSRNEIYVASNSIIGSAYAELPSLNSSLTSFLIFICERIS